MDEKELAGWQVYRADYTRAGTIEERLTGHLPRKVRPKPGEPMEPDPALSFDEEEALRRRLEEELAEFQAWKASRQQK